jgi:glyoxylase-like metal-dependent hydrolase (beta-lactamase superfamily II)
MATQYDLGHGVTVFQTPQWQTNAVLAVAGDEALVVDPGYTPPEISSLAARARQGGGPVHVLVTHADYDHVCGVAAFADAVVVTGAASAERVRSGEAASALADAGAEWGLDWDPRLRVDRELEPGEHELGAFRVAAVAADGHTVDGLAFVLVEQGVLVAGDYLSDMTFPFVGAGVERAIATYDRLLDALERYAPRWVVPGHGRPLDAETARMVGEADRTYLHRLAEAAAEARALGLAAGPALLHVFAVEPPRSTTPDFDVYGIPAANARAVLADA